MAVKAAYSILICSLAIFDRSVQAQENHYVGSAVCASCHGDISKTQAKTAMARTWLGTSPRFPASQFDEGSAPVHYRIAREADRPVFSVANAGAEPLAVAVESMIGGERHGVSLLLKVSQLGGISLDRPAMLEARYALLGTGHFVLSPGFPKEDPQDLEHALGRVLSPTFELRCLMCHGQPGTLGAGKEGGVRCESCHGPASAHVGRDGQPAAKMKSLKGNASMDVCAQCHSGFKPGSHADPVPGDLLVSSQVPALRHSECFIQSGEQLICTSCHNPHQDSPVVFQSSTAVCLRCHSLATPGHAAVCSVNQTGGCAGCHMPRVQVDAFRVTDHWIRVVSGSESVQRHPPDPSFRSQVVPKREFLRLIAVATDEEAKTVMDRLAKGESFSLVARDCSKDPSARAGGFIGDTVLADMEPTLAAAAAHLEQDSSSGVILVGNQRVILHRMARDFRWKADDLYHEALSLNGQGERSLAIKKAKAALDVYPYQLRGLNLMGVLLRQAGDASHSLAALGFAAQVYPQDAATQFNFALAQDSNKQMTALRRVIELDTDIVAAYERLGTVLEADGQHAAAIETFRAGLRIDPLSARLYHDLGLVLQQQGDAKGAANALALATRIDPRMAVLKN